MNISIIRLIYFSFNIILLSISCKNESKEVKLARFNNIFLYKSELINEIPITLNENDSAIFADNYIHKVACRSNDYGKIRRNDSTKI